MVLFYIFVNLSKCLTCNKDTEILTSVSSFNCCDMFFCLKNRKKISLTEICSWRRKEHLNNFFK